MIAPDSNVGAAAVSVGIVAAGGALGGTLASVATRKRPIQDHKLATAGGAALGILAVGLGGVATAAFAPDWRRLGLWTAAIGLGGLLITVSFAEIKEAKAAAAPPSQLPPPAGQDKVAAVLTLVPGDQAVTVPIGWRLTLMVPDVDKSALTSVSAPTNGLPSTPITGTWIALNITGPGQIILTWTDAAGATQTSNVTVSTSAVP